MKIHDSILRALTDRTVWEQRQRVWYQMRHSGIPRKRKPFPGAADMHFPLIDTAIDKLKPFYFAQAWSARKLAGFVATQNDAPGATDAAADYLDHVLRNETDLETQLLSAIDWMLLSGRGVIKARWCTESDKIEFEAVNPLYIIVPGSARTLEDADWVAHVKHLTTAQYKRTKLYRQDPDILKRITGQGAEDTQLQQQEKDAREGLTTSKDEDKVIVWEVYERNEKGWMVHTYSPNAPSEPIRPSFQLESLIKGKALLPFVGFSMEIKDAGWYSPRGIAERLAPFETALCKSWNSKLDGMAFYTVPLFATQDRLDNKTSIRFDPGSILPMGVSPVAMPEPPMSLDADMQMTRQVAEQSITMPDFGVGGDTNPGGNKTAREVSALQAVSGVGINLKGQIFRKALSQVFRIAWGLILKHRKEEMVFFTAAGRKVLPAQALHDSYEVSVAGDASDWDKNQKQNTAASLLQQLKGHPNVNQGELVREFIEATDGRLTNALFMPDGQKAASEAEDEATEITVMSHGFPCQPVASEDHATRIQILFGYLLKQVQVNAPLDTQGQMARNLITRHLAAHFEMLKQQNPAVAKQLEAQGRQAMQQLLGAQAGATAPAGPPPGQMQAQSAPQPNIV